MAKYNVTGKLNSTGRIIFTSSGNENKPDWENAVHTTTSLYGDLTRANPLGNGESAVSYDGLVMVALSEYKPYGDTYKQRLNIFINTPIQKNNKVINNWELAQEIIADDDDGITRIAFSDSNMHISYTGDLIVVRFKAPYPVNSSRTGYDIYRRNGAVWNRVQTLYYYGTNVDVYGISGDGQKIFVLMSPVSDNALCMTYNGSTYDITHDLGKNIVDTISNPIAPKYPTYDGSMFYSLGYPGFFGSMSLYVYSFISNKYIITSEISLPDTNNEYHILSSDGNTLIIYKSKVSSNPASWIMTVYTRQNQVWTKGTDTAESSHNNNPGSATPYASLSRNGRYLATLNQVAGKTDLLIYSVSSTGLVLEATLPYIISHNPDRILFTSNDTAVLGTQGSPDYPISRYGLYDTPQTLDPTFPPIMNSLPLANYTTITSETYDARKLVTTLSNNHTIYKWKDGEYVEEVKMLNYNRMVLGSNGVVAVTVKSTKTTVYTYAIGFHKCVSGAWSSTQEIQFQSDTNHPVMYHKLSVDCNYFVIMIGSNLTYGGYKDRLLKIYNFNGTNWVHQTDIVIPGNNQSSNGIGDRFYFDIDRTCNTIVLRGGDTLGPDRLAFVYRSGSDWGPISYMPDPQEPKLSPVFSGLLNPVISGDGNLLAYRGQGTSGVLIYRYTSGNWVYAYTYVENNPDIAYDNAGVTDVMITDDGSEIIFQTAYWSSDDYMSPPVKYYNRIFAVMDATTFTVKRKVYPRHHAVTYRISKDGKVLMGNTIIQAIP